MYPSNFVNVSIAFKYFFIFSTSELTAVFKIFLSMIRRWPPKQSYTKFKIKTILPEQKTINIKKTGK